MSVTASSGHPSLRVVTREIAAVEDVLAFADPRNPLVWSRRGSWLVGVGAALTLSVPARDADSLAEQWREVVSGAIVDDHVGIPGSGLIAFGALPFDAGSAHTAVLTVPQLTIGHRDGRTWASWVLPDA